MATASGVRRIGDRVERTDLWWIEPLVYVVVLGGFVVYATWASLVNGNYFAEVMRSLSFSHNKSNNFTPAGISSSRNRKCGLASRRSTIRS